MSHRNQTAAATRRKGWPLLAAGLYPIPVHPASRRPLGPWGELDRLGYQPGLGQAFTGTLDSGPPDRWVPLVFAWWNRRPGVGAAVLAGRPRCWWSTSTHATAATMPSSGWFSTCRYRLPGLCGPEAASTSATAPADWSAVAPMRSAVAWTSRVPAGWWSARRRPAAACSSRAPVAQAPPWLLARLKPVGRRRRGGGSGGLLANPAARAALDHALAAITAGERHTVTSREACKVFAATDSDQAEAKLVAAAQHACEPSEWRDRERAV